MISCKEIKLEDTTVTSQPRKPSIPEVAKMEAQQITMGITTHLISLNIIHKMTTRSPNNIDQYMRKSFFTKLIKSSATILTPPKNNFPSLLWFCMMERIFLIKLSLIH